MLDLRVEHSTPAADNAAFSGEPAQVVLLVSRAGDTEVGLVRRRLEAAGVPVARLDAETAASAGLIIDPQRRLARIDGRWISPTVTWLRHFTPRAIPQGRGALRRAYAADSWLALADQLDVVSAAMIAHREPRLLAQLAAARGCGVAVPTTIVTTKPAQVAALVPGSKLVIKALHRHFVEARPGLLHGVFPQVIDRRDLGRIPAGPPVVVQEHIDHEAEIRVYHVHGQIAAAFVITKPDPAAPWLRPELVTARQIEPPDAIAAAASAVATAMSIDYGAFDFLVAEGEPVFLEVNLAGDWRWLETRVRKAPVTAAVATMLRRKHEQIAGVVQTRPTQLDPVTFLSRRIAPTGVDKDERSL
ncbi:MAG TPA: hypothetical protein VEV63_08135 [Streptosporangiaceae bacterium]|nr:hypothetical protein [Streptosporangiaceae bacterium]